MKKHMSQLREEQTEEAWNKYMVYFLNEEIQHNIRQSEEEQFQEGFLRELFVKIFGYTLNPSPNFNLITEKKNETGVKISTALQTFDLLTFADFTKELKKQKISLTLSQQDEWEDYFNDYCNTCHELSAQIAQTDKDIDNKVFDIYGLTNEERKTVSITF